MILLKRNGDPFFCWVACRLVIYEVCGEWGEVSAVWSSRLLNSQYGLVSSFSNNIFYSKSVVSVTSQLIFK